MLLEQGVQRADLCWLVQKGLISEVGNPRRAQVDPRAGFRCVPVSSTSSFVLTPAGLIVARRLAEDLASSPPAEQRPIWYADRGELFWGDVLVKRFRQPAESQTRILAAFEEEGWPPHIDDPLPPEDGLVPAERLRATVRNLNAHHAHDVIRFESDGHGEGVLWRRVTGPAGGRDAGFCSE